MDFMILHKWLHESDVVLNPGKCHYIVIGDDGPSHKMILNNNEIASSNVEKLLGILLDRQLTLSLILHLFVKKQGKNLVLLQE